MGKRSYSLICRYGATVPLIGLAILLTALLPPLEQSPSTLFVAAVVVSAWCGGLGPGLLATILSVITLDYFFVPPVYSLGVGVTDAVRLGLFALVSILISSLNEARKRLEGILREQNRHKEEFLALLAHELRSPLSASLNALEILRLQGAETATAERTRQLIKRQIRTMTHLINDLLDVSRLRLGKLRLCKQSVDLGRAVTNAVETARPLIDARGHRLEVSMPPGPLYLEADPTRLEQVIVNLLANAAKYTPAQGRIWLIVERSHSHVGLRVKDTGVGLAPEFLPHIFDRFAQAESGFQGGLGIGLNLARDLVELHGGTLTACSDGLGCGSEFTVALPWRADLSEDDTELEDSELVGRDT
jgi:signal transduction histidine kinase